MAPKLQMHFSRHLSAARQEGHQELAAQPDLAVIEAVVEAAFWASLRREEGYPPKISLAFLPPEQAGRPLILERPLPLAPEALIRLSPAVERPGIHLGVWRQRDELFVWGATRTIPTFCFVLEVAAPGLLVVKHRRVEDSGKFANVAVFEGDQIKLLEQRSTSLRDCTVYTALLSSLLGETAGSSNVLVELAVSMRAHGRGGSLLVVPAATAAWRESIMRPIPYPVAPPFSGLAELIREDAGEKHSHSWQEALRRTVDAIAGLTAVDGATVIADQYELLAFGAKIGRREGWPEVEQVELAEPIEDAAPRVVDTGQLGGTRHQSAAQFAQDQRDAIALVASQDGRFTVFTWSPSRLMVQAYRIEMLLL